MNKQDKNLIMILSIGVLVSIFALLILYLKKPGILEKDSIVDYRKEIRDIQTQSDSDEIGSIEEDLEDTEITNIDKELDDIEAEINASY